MVKYYCDKCNKEMPVFKSGNRKGNVKAVDLNFWGDITSGHVSGHSLLCETCFKDALELLTKNKLIKVDKEVRNA